LSLFSLLPDVDIDEEETSKSSDRGSEEEEAFTNKGETQELPVEEQTTTPPVSKTQQIIQTISTISNSSTEDDDVGDSWLKGTIPYNSIVCFWSFLKAQQRSWALFRLIWGRIIDW
jgi:hypothetical protein